MEKVFHNFIMKSLLHRNARFFIFDVESIGLHGEGFAVACGVYNGLGAAIEGTEMVFACPPGSASSFTPLRDLEDRDWIHQNVPLITPTHVDPLEVRNAFWKYWKRMQKEYNAGMFAECAWPVEANFLNRCVSDNPSERVFRGPYPLHEIATIMFAAGMDPMETYERVPCELPAHNPLGDIRLSARLLADAIGIISSK